MLVPRRARKLTEPQTPAVESPAELLTKYRALSAWVLLGEPGAGKTQAFEAEAEATGGICLSIGEFLQDPPVLSANQPLFLDGLDEYRASGSDESVLLKLRRRLRELGNPPFRIACRAADWYGDTDKGDIEAASPDDRFATLLLEPLSQADIAAILGENHGVPDPQAFIEQAGRLGVANLLDNPQTLEMLAKAVRGDQWPGTREQTYQLACEKLAEDANKRHRDARRERPIAVEKLLDAAGHLSAVLLLSDRAGVALDPGRADERFLAMEDSQPPDLAAARRVVGLGVFRPDGEERVVPRHRSIAEYLAARWLAARIDRDGLPLGRVLKLMLGQDGRTVAGLRGLYAWLALHCLSARRRLCVADPLTVVVYGDVKPMPAADKRLILEGLHREAKQFVGFRWEVQARHSFGALADAELSGDFLAALHSPDRDDVGQAYALLILDILAEGGVSTEVLGVLPTLIRDDLHSMQVRETALEVWLNTLKDTQAARALLDDIADGRVIDQDDNLIGLLLDRLYPDYLAPEEVLRYLHVPINRAPSGNYRWFWEHEFPRLVLDEHLPILLDDFAQLPWLQALSPYGYQQNGMVSMLLSRGIEKYGDSIDDARLYTWLGVGVGEHGEILLGSDASQEIAGWLSARPDRYKAVLNCCYEISESLENPSYGIHDLISRLYDATLPADIGLWHLDHVSTAVDPDLAKIHLAMAVRTLIHGQGDQGLSLERLEAWGDQHPEKKDWLDSLLKVEIPDSHLKRTADRNAREQALAELRNKRINELTPVLKDIEACTARSGLMHGLAGVWMHRFYDTPGATPAERFDSYCDNGPAILATAEAGFRRCPERPDLPTVDEIIELNQQRQEHYIRMPCLVGMALRWQDDPASVECLTDPVLERMIAFRLTYGAEATPDWFVHLVRRRPELVAGVLVAYAGKALKGQLEHIDSIYPLENDPAYREVAVIAAPRLLELFPVRARTGQLNYLDNLLKASLRYTREAFAGLIETKLALKGMDVAQKVYWLAAGALLDPARYEPRLWRFVGASSAKTNYLSGFLYGSRLSTRAASDYELSAAMIGKLIERLAPDAETEWPAGGGFVTDAMRRGEHVRSLVSRLGALATPEAETEIERLLALPALAKLKFALESARHQLRSRLRESGFSFPSPPAVAQVLANQAPSDIADLAALALDLIDKTADDIRRDNDDGFRGFWNVENKQPVGQREENLCRDALFTRLRPHLERFGIEGLPEKDHANDRRADLSLSYRAQFELPIEIKRDSNASLWSGLRKQLIEHYASAPRAHGYGIYLVLWFGEAGLPRVVDGGKKPVTPDEVRARIEAQLDPEERRRIFVRVLDVSWPK